MIKHIKNANVKAIDFITITLTENKAGLASVKLHFADYVKAYEAGLIKGLALTDTDKEKMILFAQGYLFKTFTLDHTGKMQGKKSLTVSSCKCNEFCKRMQKVPGAICSKCFANNQLSIQHSTDNKMQRNAAIWGAVKIPFEFLPVIPFTDFRIDSFGEFRNDTDVYNVMKLAEKSGQSLVRIWTKRPDLVQRYCDNNGKPCNVWILYSSPFINDQNVGIFKKYPCVDSIFTVFDKAYIAANNIKINCGGLQCMTCTGGKCYSKKPERLINEQLK